MLKVSNDTKKESTSSLCEPCQYSRRDLYEEENSKFSAGSVPRDHTGANGGICIRKHTRWKGHYQYC